MRDLLVRVAAAGPIRRPRRIALRVESLIELKRQLLDELEVGDPAMYALQLCEGDDDTRPPLTTLEQLGDSPTLQIALQDVGSDRKVAMRERFLALSAADTSLPVKAAAAGEANWSSPHASSPSVDADEGEDIDGTVYRRFVSDGNPYFYNTETGETQWEVPAEVVAATGAGTDVDCRQGDVVTVRGRPELWIVVQSDSKRVQVQLQGKPIKKWYARAEVELQVSPQSASNVAPSVGLSGSTMLTGLVEASQTLPYPEALEMTRKLRIFLANSVSAHSDLDEPVGFVMVTSSATLAKIRAEIVDDELEVPVNFVFLVDGDVAKRSHERKITAEHFFMQRGSIRVAQALNPISSATIPQQSYDQNTVGASAEVDHISDVNDTSDTKDRLQTHLPILAGYLSAKQGLFASWQRRYFRLSNGTLSYFLSPDDKVAAGSVVIDETCVVENAGDRHKKKFCFEICTWRGPLPVCAECDEDFQLWKAHVKDTVRCIEALAAQKGIKRGQVYKRDGFFRKWKLKWAILSRTTLNFYDSPEDPAKQRDPTDEFNLAGATVCAEEIEGRAFCFTIRRPQCQVIEISASDKQSLNSWLAFVAQNIALAPRVVDGSTANENTTSWGVKNVSMPAHVSGSGWGFDVKGVEGVEVLESRQTRINGEKTTEFFFQVNHISGSMSWLISRQLNDVLDLHGTFKNTDPTKFEYLDKFIQVPVGNKTKDLNAIELEQNKTVIRVYMEEALKQAVPAEHESLGRLLSPTMKGYDEQRGYLSVMRRASVSHQPQRRWCRLSSSDHTFSWSVDKQSRGLQINLQNAILVSEVRFPACCLVVALRFMSHDTVDVQPEFLPSALSLEIIARDCGTRLNLEADDRCVWRQWHECLKMEVSDVISNIQEAIVRSNGYFSVNIALGKSVPWLGAETPDATAIHINRRRFSLSCGTASRDHVRLSDPDLYDRQSAASANSGSDDEDSYEHDDERVDEDHEDHDDLDYGDSSSLSHKQSLRRLSAAAGQQLDARVFSWQVSVDSNDVVVMDTGSCTVKAGIASDGFPSVVLRSHDPFTGVPLVRREHSGGATVDPTVTTDWDAVQNMWETIFENSLGINSEEHRFLLTEAPDMTRVSKEQMAEIMFETFNTPALGIESAGVLALYAQGMRTGIVVDCGNRTKITPIADGYPLPHAILQSSFGGLDIDRSLSRFLVDRYGTSYAGDHFIRDCQLLKEQLGYIAISIADERKKPVTELAAKFRMHTGTNLQFDCERFECGETLFSATMPNGCQGLPEAINWCISKCESVLRNDLFGAIVLCGGSTCIDGFPTRLQQEIANAHSRTGLIFTSEAPAVKMVAPSNRKFMPWIGGARLAQMDGFAQRIVTQADFDERGCSVLHDS